MSFIFTCPCCQNRFNAEETWCGMTLECPACHNQVVIQKEMPPQQPVPQTPAAAGSFLVSCPNCSQQLEIREEWRGMQVSCPSCQQTLIIPPAEPAAAPVPPPAETPVPPPASPVPENNETASEPLKLYSPNAAGLWSLLFSGIFGSWCIWKNYRTIGDKKAALRSKLWIYSFLVLYVATIFLPAPGGIATAALIIWYFAEQRRQVKYLAEKNIRYKKKSWLKPVSIVLGVELLLAGSFLLIWTSLKDASTKAKTLNCASNLRMIGTALKLWQLDHDDKNPKRLEELDLVDPANVLKCPLCGKKYLYVSGLDSKVSQDCPVAYCLGHEEEILTLYADGHFEYCKKSIEEIEQQIKKYAPNAEIPPRN